VSLALAVGFLAISMVFVYRSFYAMRIKTTEKSSTPATSAVKAKAS
jgi:hypothetical protein